MLETSIFSFSHNICYSFQKEFMILTLYLICQFLAFQIQHQIKYDVKNMNKWGYNYLIGLKTLWEKEKLLVTSNFSFSHNVFKSCLLLMRQNEYLWNRGLGYNYLSSVTAFKLNQSKILSLGKQLTIQSQVSQAYLRILEKTFWGKKENAGNFQLVKNK